MISFLTQFGERHDQRSEAVDAAYLALRNDFLDALASSNLMAVVSTPAFVGCWRGARFMTVVEVVADLMAGDAKDEYLREMLALVNLLATNEGETPAARIRAQALQASMACKHAEFHADDLADAA